MKKISKHTDVLKFYPDAKCVKVKRHVEITLDNGQVLGRGENNKCAWASAWKNIN